MKTINEIKDDDLVFNEQTQSQVEASDCGFRGGNLE